MTLEQLQSKAERKLNEVLRSMILEQSIFPLVIPIAKPSTTAPLMELRATDSLIRSQSREVLGYGFTVEWQTVNSRKNGQNEFPKKLSFADSADYLRYVGAKADAERILSNAKTIIARYPTAQAWCAAQLNFMRKAPECIAHALIVADYFKNSPTPNCFARQLSIPVPTKFIEEERGLLESFFKDQIPEAFLQEEGSFEERIGLTTKESFIEFRSLDSNDNSLPFQHGMATAKEMDQKEVFFAEFDTVLVVENHVPFLTLPEMPRTLAIMGNGFAVHRLAQIGWLKSKRLLYWGDLDISGFAILAKFRQSYSDAISLMMDEATFERFKDYQQTHSAQQNITVDQLSHLNEEERRVIQQLRADDKLRIEQEHIDYSFVETILKKAIY